MNKWEIGDKLVCLDVEAYLNIDNQWVSSRRKIVESSLVIDHFYENGAIGLEDINYCIPVSDFQHFKKKEDYTFNDLIDVAVHAWKDDVTKSITLVDGVLCVSEDRLSDAIVAVGDKASSQFYSDAIHAIQSLYKETFVIECEEDCKKIKQNAKITFLNGNSVVMDQPPTDDGIVRIWNDRRYDFILLKGATVVQERTQ